LVRAKTLAISKAGSITFAFTFNSICPADLSRKLLLTQVALRC
jgi:hypothetical protein